MEIGIYSTTTGEKVSSTDAIRCKNYIPVLASTEYYLKGAGLSGIYGVFYYDSDKNFISSVTQVTNSITTPANACYMTFRCYVSYGTTYNHDVCINLSDSSRNGTYEPYQKFTLPLNLDSIKVKSHNIWDEEWENTSIDNSDGETRIANTGVISSKNKIRVFSGSTYYIKNGTINAMRIFLYNEGGTYIESVVLNPVNTTYTIPAGVGYINFQYVSTTSYNHDVCINLSSEFNGKYEPHGILTMTGGLKSAGSVYDEIKDGKYVKRIGEVDLGDLSWVYRSDRAVFSINEASMRIFVNGSKVVCDKYACTNASTVANMEDKSVGCIVHYNSNDLIVKDSSYSDAATFKAAMSGVMLNYELATPEEYDLVEPISTDYPVDKLGTERVISDTVPTPPFRADIEYHEANIKDIEVEGITDYLKREELTDELDKLQDIESGAQVNKIEHIQINGTEQTISNKTVNLPAYPTTLPASDVYS